MPKHLPIHLTEFGIQSTPDKISGVSLERQAAYLAVAEHIAYVNPRVAAFSQYLLSDDSAALERLPLRRLRERPDLRRRQAEAGLQRLPAAARGRALRRQRRALGARASGARGDAGDDRVQDRRRGKWRTLKTLTTTASGVYALKTPRKRHYRVRWTAPSTCDDVLRSVGRGY